MTRHCDVPDDLLPWFDPAALQDAWLIDVTRWEPGGGTSISEFAASQLLITFRTNSTKLTESARAARGLQSSKLAELKFRIEGHADPRGSASANMKLSEGRAASVVRYLTHQGGVAGDRLTSVGKGATEPLNTDNATAPENRRVTIVAVKK
jgi:outer membrane protein OmpA-like peptidoglycan-associated protein